MILEPALMANGQNPYRTENETAQKVFEHWGLQKTVHQPDRSSCEESREVVCRFLKAWGFALLKVSH